ncbi:MAG: type II secretion system GspH family protein [Halanaerobiales bacterium]|nr:type II secretion system GspH family protein [Halanaerobiales bacterium]
MKFTEILSRDHGYSLVELLFVIIILGIISSAIYVQVANINNEAKNVSLKSTAYSLQKSIKLHLAETDKLPIVKNNLLKFKKSSIDFRLTDEFELDDLDSFNNDTNNYSLKIYELNNNGNRTGKYAILTNDNIILTE